MTKGSENRSPLGAHGRMHGNDGARTLRSVKRTQIRWARVAASTAARQCLAAEILRMRLAMLSEGAGFGEPS